MKIILKLMCDNPFSWIFYPFLRGDSKNSSLHPLGSEEKNEELYLYSRNDSKNTIGYEN